MNATVVPHGALGYLTLWANGTHRPLASTLNALDGAVTSNMAIIPTGNGWIDAFASSSTQLLLDITSYFGPITPAITTTTLPTGSVGSFYSFHLQAAGGFPPYTWTLQDRNLPPGLTLGSDGLVSGTPTSNGAWSFTVRVTDTESQFSSANLSLTIQQGQPLTLF